LKTLFDDITHQLEKSHRPLFVPPQGHSVDNANKALNNLRQKEAETENIIREELARQVKITEFTSQYNALYNDLENFTQAKENSFKTREEIQNLSDSNRILRYLNLDKNDIEKKRPLLENIISLSKKLQE